MPALRLAISHKTRLNTYQQRLVFRGELLPGDGLLTDHGLRDGSVIYLVPLPEQVTIKIKSTVCEPITLSMDIKDIVLSIKQQIMPITGLKVDQQHIIFNGKLLENEMTLGYYMIHDNATLTLLSVRKKEEFKTRPSVFMKRLSDLIEKTNRFPSAELIQELSELVEDPVLCSYSKFNKKAKKLIEDAIVLIENFDISMSLKTAQAIASYQDLTITQYESTLDGLRYLQEQMASDELEEDIIHYDMPTNLSYEKKLSTAPLPKCWGTKPTFPFGDFNMEFDEQGRPTGRDIADGDMMNPLKQKFARQIQVLKKMGFTDEEVILMALNETSGNVPQAARILFERFSHV